MNASLARYCALLLLAAACAPTAVQQKEDAINAALASAYVACRVALDDPKSDFAPGAREYCMAVVNGCPK